MVDPLNIIRLQKPPTAKKETFVCERCGACCRGEGFVWVSDDDIARAAKYLNMTPAEFVRRYAYRIPGTDDIVLIDKDDRAQSCIFLEEDGCAINPVKPEQCVGFPWKWSRTDAEQICAALRRMGKDEE